MRNQTFENIQPSETGDNLARHLKSNGWDGVVYHGTVRTPRTRRDGLFYRNAKTGEFCLIAS